MRPISTIAWDIKKHWRDPYFAAVPYLDAMCQLDGIDDAVMHDSARSILNYFLSNARYWKGPDAKRLKAEIRELLK